MNGFRIVSQSLEILDTSFRESTKNSKNWIRNILHLPRKSQLFIVTLNVHRVINLQQQMFKLTFKIAHEYLRNHSCGYGKWKIQIKVFKKG